MPSANFLYLLFKFSTYSIQRLNCKISSMTIEEGFVSELYDTGIDIEYNLNISFMVLGRCSFQKLLISHFN